MIIDSHSHAWSYWPYTSTEKGAPVVPDPESRGRVEQLLHEMDTNGVDRAVIICASIEHNPGNNAYIAAQVQRYPDRLVQFADLDCEWSPTYHQPGAAARLRELAARYPLKGFTHYLRQDEDGTEEPGAEVPGAEVPGAWLYSEEGLALFHTAAELGLIASLSLHPRQQAALRQMAGQVPHLPILCHHLGGAKLSHPETLEEVLASAALPNIYIKVSGFAYYVEKNWEYPYPESQETLRALYTHFGAARLCWGSDYPVVRYFMTYRQSLEVLRSHCDFIPVAEKEQILGLNLARLLHRAE